MYATLSDFAMVKKFYDIIKKVEGYCDIILEYLEFTVYESAHMCLILLLVSMFHSFHQYSKKK